MDELKKKIAEKSDELHKLQCDLFSLEREQKSTRKLGCLVSSSAPPFTRFRFGDKMYCFHVESKWTSTTVEHTNTETGKKYTRYQTVVEADARRTYGFKMPHGVKQIRESNDEKDGVLGGLSRYATGDCEWYLFETDAPLIDGDSIAYIEEEEADRKRLRYDESGEAGTVELPPILLFATRRQEQGFAWVNYPFPALTLYRENHKNGRIGERHCGD